MCAVQARIETEQKNGQIQMEIRSIDEQGAQRQQYIDELKSKLEQVRSEQAEACVCVCVCGKCMLMVVGRRALEVQCRVTVFRAG
jgi:hypothetical protein